MAATQALAFKMKQREDCRFIALNSDNDFKTAFEPIEQLPNLEHVNTRTNTQC